MLNLVKTIGRDYERQIRRMGYDLPDVGYELMSKQAFRTYGQWSTRFITPNYGVVRINPNIVKEEDLRVVIAHELAHAVKAKGNKGHNAVWRSICHNIFKTLGLDTAKATRQGKIELKSAKTIKYRMTAYGASIQSHTIYKDTTKVFTTDIITTGQGNRYKNLERANIIEILEEPM